MASGVDPQDPDGPPRPRPHLDITHPTIREIEFADALAVILEHIHAAGTRLISLSASGPSRTLTVLVPRVDEDEVKDALGGDQVVLYGITCRVRAAQ